MASDENISRYLDERWWPKAAKGSDHVGIFEMDRWLLSIEWKKRKSRKISTARLITPYTPIQAFAKTKCHSFVHICSLPILVVMCCYVVAMQANIRRDPRRALVGSSQHKCQPSAGSTSGRPSGGGSVVRLIALAPPIPSACSFSRTRCTTSGSGSGSTFLGATRGQSLHFSCPQF
jgi:hypothetical protein